MKAIVLKKPKTLALIDVPVFELKEKNHVLIKVKACGICGSDLRYWAGDNPWALHTLGKHIDNPPNMIMGHEFAGEVVKVNTKKYEHLLGQKVGVQSYRVCGKCYFCTSGRENLCREMIHIGHAQGWGSMDYYPGAYAEYCPGWADLLHPIADHLTYAEAAMADILCVAVHITGRANIYKGANILCIGGGPAGLSIAQVAKSKGAGKIFISDPSAVARQVISNYPEFTVIDPIEQDPVGLIRAMLGEAKCAAIFDSVGSNETLKMALLLLEESGTYINLAVHKTEFKFDASLIGSERTITTSSNAFYRDLVEAYDLLNRGIIDVKPWITHRLPLDEYEKAFKLLLKYPKEAYKVVFEP
jgi:threonine dehydrogenase-like Zn-dependent dehydrogenase